MIYGLILSVLLNCVLGYVTWNLLRKTELMEDEIASYLTFFQNLDTATQQILHQLKQIDLRGSFEQDDEVGVIYKGIHGVVLQLKDFFSVKGGEDA